MPSPTRPNRRRDYGSTAPGDADGGRPIHLHASLESLDTGPHAFRTSLPRSPQRDAPSAGERSPSQGSLLTSPLLRSLSFQDSKGDAPSGGAPTLGTIQEKKEGTEEPKGQSFIYYVIYAAVNSIMCVPCLYGYASVIFNHNVFQPHINALSKLVILSSVVHQFCFTIFSSLPFSIGQVQDAGLIFLSAMTRRIANSIIDDAGGKDGVDEDVVATVLSTTIVMLGLSTACLGALLIVAGKFRLADAVAYLPLPVVGGYLAFIGYFCFEAGVALW